MQVEEREGAHREFVPGGWWSEVVVPSFRGAPAVLAVAVTVVVSLWRGVAVAAGHWTQDDYVGLSQAATRGLGSEFLGGSHAGEFSAPARFLLWCVQSLTGSSWAVVALLATFLTVAVCLLAWVVLSQVLEARWVRLPLLAIVCFAPLAWAGTLHFTLLLIHLPSLFLFLLGLSLLLHHAQSPSRGVGATGALVLLLLVSWTDQSALLVVAAFLVVLGTGISRSGGLAAGWADFVASRPGVWVLVGVGVLGRIVVMAVRDVDGLGVPDSVGSAVEVVGVLVRQSAVSLVGGPWTGDVQGTQLVASANWPTAAAVLICVAGIGVMLRSVRAVEVRFALAGTVLVTLVAWAVLVLTNSAWNALAMVPRTAAVLVPAVVLVVAVGLRGTVVPARLRSARLFAPSRAAVLLAVLVGASSVPSAAALVPSLQNADDREYLDRLETALASDPSVVVLDGPVPDGVMHLSLGEAAKVSTLAPVLPHEPFFDRPSSALRMVDGWGVLQPVVVASPIEVTESEDETCGYAVRAEGTTIPFEEPLSAGTYLVQIDYFTNASSTMSVSDSEGVVSFPVREGLRSVQFPWTVDGASGVSLKLDSDTDTVCVGELLVGTAQSESDRAAEEEAEKEAKDAKDEKSGPAKAGGKKWGRKPSDGPSDDSDDEPSPSVTPGPEE